MPDAGRASIRLHEPIRDRESSQSRDRVDAERAGDMLSVRLHRARAEPEETRDVPARIALGDQNHHLTLSLREQREAAFLTLALADGDIVRARRAGTEVHSAAVDSFDGADELRRRRRLREIW